MLFPIDNRFLNDATREREEIKTENSVRNRGKN
jgi:hypothetical protein